MRSNATFISKNHRLPTAGNEGGALCGEANTSVVLESSIFHDNFAFVKGGVLRLKGARLTIRACKFYNNQLFNLFLHEEKGHIWYNNVHIVVKDSLLRTTDTQDHLVYYCQDFFTMHMYLLNGGVLYCGPGCNATFEGSNFHNNRAFTGGVAYLDKWSAIRFRSCTFTQNYARLDGGVVFMQANGHIVFDDCNVSNNEVDRFMANDNYGFGGLQWRRWCPSFKSSWISSNIRLLVCS